MSPSAPSQLSIDAVLAEIVEEFTNRLQAGEDVDAESYAQRHPEHAERIRQLLPALAVLAEVGRSAHSDSAGAPRDAAEDALSGTLGDFRLLREVGRGGMGIVYEAEQISLKRRVALKVLPFAATMDPRHLQRFHNEAQAAACLHHTNIVPVHFVGCERGVHFYAMQFIEGQPLSDIIRQLHQAEKKMPAAAGETRTIAYQPAPGDVPTPRPVADKTPLTGEGRRGRDYFRKVAELGMQAAEALDHAHQLGIVHRDIKPANLLLDARGNLWVTDFGLAHIQQSDGNLTVTGQALGTPRYMSPEQALAKRVPIDHRTDVYSLGATLYELLTLRPAFASEDRQELLRQIAFEDPAHPRRLSKAIPAELEIIVLKAMEKRPQDRYATAQELADDLRRWLMNEPIRARRPGMVQRAVKWGRRHRSLVAAGVLCLFLALVMLAISNVVIWREHEETKAALRKAKLHQQEVDILAAKMIAAREQSEVKLLSSLQAMDHILTALEEPFPEEGTESARMYKAASEQAMKFYEDVLPIKADNPYLRWEVMWTYVRLGSLCALHNKFTEAQQAYRWAVFYAEMCPWLLSEDGVRLRLLAPDDFQELDRAGLVPERPAVEKVYRHALAHWRKTSPKGLGGVQDYRTELSRKRLDNLSDEISLWERVVEDLPTLSNVNRLLGRYREEGEALRKAGRSVEAKAIYHRAVKHIENAVHDPVFTASLTSETFNVTPRAGSDDLEIVPDSSWSSRAEDLAKQLYEFGIALDQLGMSADAEAASRASLVLYKQLIPANHPVAEGIRRIPANHSVAERIRECELRADVDGKLTALLSGQKQPADNTERLRLARICQSSKNRYVTATRLYREVFAAEPKLTGDRPSLPRYNAACAAALAGCGQGPEAAALDAKDRTHLRQEALDWLRTELEAWRKLLEKEPNKLVVERPEEEEILLLLQVQSLVEQTMQHWQQDRDFGGMRLENVDAEPVGQWNWIPDQKIGVRGPEALAHLPEAERLEWQKLWQKVEALRQRAAKAPTAASTPQP